MGCKQQWRAQLWAVPLKGKVVFPFPSSCLLAGWTVVTVWGEKPPGAWRLRTSVEQSHYIYLGFYMRNKLLLFKSLLYGSLCYSSQTNSFTNSLLPLNQSLWSRDKICWLARLGIGALPWTERGGRVAPQGIWGCYHQKNVKWVLHRQR